MSARTTLGCVISAAGSLVLVTGLAGAAPGDLDPTHRERRPSSHRGCALRRLVPVLGVASGQQGGDGRDEPPDGAAATASGAAQALRAQLRGRGLLRRAPGREWGDRPLVRVERNRSNSDRPRPRRPRSGARRGGRAGRIDHRGRRRVAGQLRLGRRVRSLLAGRRVDPSFSGDGIQTVDLGPQDIGYDAVVQSDGKIVAVATTPTYDGFEVVRLNPDGSPDQSFGSGGVVRTPIGNPSLGDESLTVALDGPRIVVGGDADFRHGCRRLRCRSAPSRTASSIRRSGVAESS